MQPMPSWAAAVFHLAIKKDSFPFRIISYSLPGE